MRVCDSIMNNRIIARHPILGLLVMLFVGLVACYLCFDLKYLHYLVFSRGVTAQSTWFWPIFGGFILLTLYCLKEIFLPKKLLLADASGLVFGHRALRRKVRVAWKDVQDMRITQITTSTGSGRGSMEAIRFVVRTSENLGGVVSNMSQGQGNIVSLAACLFEDDVGETLDNLCAMQTMALQPPASSSRKTK